MGIWCNEAQERYVLIVDAQRVEEFSAMCARERCPHSVIGTLTGDGKLAVNDRDFDNRIVDMPMQMLLGRTPQMFRAAERVAPPAAAFATDDIDLATYH